MYGMISRDAATEEMRSLIRGLVGTNILTRGPSRRTNRTVAFVGNTVQIETDKSRREHSSPTIPLEWFADAWLILERDGYLERANLARPMKYRSAAVFAILAQHPCVDDVTKRTIRLELDRGCLG
jgi:hypothetical protein